MKFLFFVLAYFSLNLVFAASQEDLTPWMGRWTGVSRSIYKHDFSQVICKTLPTTLDIKLEHQKLIVSCNGGCCRQVGDPGKFLLSADLSEVNADHNRLSMILSEATNDVRRTKSLLGLVVKGKVIFSFGDYSRNQNSNPFNGFAEELIRGGGEFTKTN
ncbi:MAG: hypothetical protein ACXVB1_15925 [Pseudobdellovibrionaceae bacterium]